MGGTVAAGRSLRLLASVSGADGQRLEWIVDGSVVNTVTLTATPQVFEWPAGAARWCALVVRDASGPTLLSNAVYATAPSHW